MAVAGAAIEARERVGVEDKTTDRGVPAPNVKKAPPPRPRGESDMVWIIPFFLILAGALVFFFWQVSINTNPIG